MTLDEAPQEWFVCNACDGSGEEVFGYWGYEPGCTHGHMMEEGRPCSKCHGDGGWIGDAEFGVSVITEGGAVSRARHVAKAPLSQF